ncbi:MAG: SDR family NAD(P)-dependent oxidoreductase [Rickettsiales bacterium]|jgi:short-subunit dehydrogenase|nr:SDR family NAD(P)-dependent oxidoreductase [Rickettsiales bacterium]
MTILATHSWIIGASSGIGEALAKELANRGETVCVSARSKEALAALVSSLNGTGHIALPLDVSSREEVLHAVQSLRVKFPRIDRVIFMAGIYTPMSFGSIDLDEAERIIKVNLTSPFYVVEAVLPVLIAQGGGQIALCASVAGYRGLPKSQPYGATKAGLINLAESLAAEVPKQIDVRVINPGFVESRLTNKNNFKMPMRISSHQAAKAIVKGLDSSGFEIHFPKTFTRMMKLLSVLPNWLYFAFMRRQ